MARGKKYSPPAISRHCAPCESIQSLHSTPNDLRHCSRLVLTSCCYLNDLLRDADEFTPRRVPED